MGTNYYLMSKNKELVHQYFPNETTYNCYDCGYEIVEEPYLGYQIHICKTSCGWVPLFQNHDKAYKYFTGFEKFYQEHQNDLDIFDEYGEQYTYEEFKTRMISHSQREPESVKWEYSPYLNSTTSVIHTVHCSEEEAELWIPFRHDEYQITECEARKKFHDYSHNFSSSNYDRDPDYNFDWVKGDFG